MSAFDIIKAAKQNVPDEVAGNFPGTAAFTGTVELSLKSCQVDKPVTTILLGPMGAGKSTLIADRRREGKKFVHMDRDARALEQLQGVALDSPTDWTTKDLRRIREAVKREEKNFYIQLRKEFKENALHVVIDYAPGGNQKWMIDVMNLSKRAGRKVIVEGIVVDPEQTGIKRILERTPNSIINHNRFKDAIRTYKDMPDQFLRAAYAADEAYLHDNNR